MNSIRVVTVSYNASSFVLEFVNCFMAASAYSYNHGLKVDLTVLDNFSDDDTAAIVEAAIREKNINAKLVRNTKNIGSSAGYNQVINSLEAAPGEYILLINNDTLFSKDFFNLIYASLDQEFAVITPSIVCYPEVEKFWFRGGVLSDTSPTGIKLSACYGERVTYAPSCCWLFKKEVFSQVGGFDERYFVYWEDADFCRSLRQLNLRIKLEPLAKLSHRVSASSSSEFAVQQYSKNQILYMNKHFAWPKFFIMLIVILFVGILRVVLVRESLSLARIRFFYIFSSLRLVLSRSFSR